MSQLVGRKLPQKDIPGTGFIPVSAENSDGNGNAALHTMVLGGSNKSHSYVDNIDPAIVNYTGEAAAGTDEGRRGWRITKTTDVNGDGAEVITTHAYTPARTDLGTFANIAAIEAAYPSAAPGDIATALDTGIVYIWDWLWTQTWLPEGAPVQGIDDDPLELPPVDAIYGGFDHYFINLSFLQTLVYDDPTGG
jgi:hypothetical protein